MYNTTAGTAQLSIWNCHYWWNCWNCAHATTIYPISAPITTLCLPPVPLIQQYDSFNSFLVHQYNSFDRFLCLPVPLPWYMTPTRPSSHMPNLFLFQTFPLSLHLSVYFLSPIAPPHPYPIYIFYAPSGLLGEPAINRILSEQSTPAGLHFPPSHFPRSFSNVTG